MVNLARVDLVHRLPAPVRARADELYLAGVAACAFVARVIVATRVRATGLFADDYDYLNKAVFYLRGDFEASSYPFRNVAAGILYPLLISPWQMFDGPSVRMFVVFVINAACGALVVYFGSKAIWRAVGRNYLAPVVLAVLGSVFLFTYLAMTENLLFVLLAIGAFLAAEAKSAFTRWWWLPTFAVLCVAAPLVRTPGIALAGGLAAALVVYHWRRPRFWLALGVAGSAVAIGITAYLAMRTQMPQIDGVHREGAYVAALRNVFASPQNLGVTLGLAVNQLYYLTIATAFFPLVAVIAALCGTWKRDEMPLVGFATATTLGFLFFGLLHILRKVSFEAGANFIYGRYNDPAVLVLVISGLAILCTQVRPNRVQSWIMRFGGPILLALALARVAPHKWWSLNQLGLSIFPQRSTGIVLGIAGVVVVTIALLSQTDSRNLWRVAVPIMVVFHILSIASGLRMTTKRANLVHHATEAATWIHDNVPEDECILYDARVGGDPAPKSAKHVSNAYRAMMFLTWPREFRSFPKSRQRCPIVYTTKDAFTYTNWTPAWTNGDYTVYRIDHDQPAQLAPMPPLVLHFTPRDFKVSDPRMQRGSSIMMAWDAGFATSRPVWLPPGQYRLTARVQGTGCQSPPPELELRVGLQGSRQPVDASTDEVALHFEVHGYQRLGIRITSFEKPACADGADKNIIVHGVRLSQQS